MSYANRGKALQLLINHTNQTYKMKGWAVVDEVPTPTKNIRGKMVYEKKSTVDYYGITRGRAIAFDAKSTKEISRFDLKNVHDHQVKYLMDFQKQGGLSFFIIEFAKKHEHYFVPLNFFMKFWNDALKGGKKSIPYEEFLINCSRIQSARGVPLDYIKHCG